MMRPGREDRYAAAGLADVPDALPGCVHVPAHIQGMTTQFNEADHPRGPGGKFTVKAHPEQDVDLTAPASRGKRKQPDQHRKTPP